MLAAWLHEQGHSVVLADCDTQQGSSEWIKEACPGVRTVRLDNPDHILNELPVLAQDADYVVADGPGSQTETSRALLLRADFAIVPCKASMLEVRALAKATEVLRQAQDIRRGAPQAVINDAPGQGAVVWNMGARAREALDEVKRLFSEILPDAKGSRGKSKKATERRGQHERAQITCRRAEN